MFQAFARPFLDWLEVAIGPQIMQVSPVGSLMESSRSARNSQSTPPLDSTPFRDPKDLRVVIVAEHASMQFGGEAALPVHYFRRLRQRGIEAWLVVHERTQVELMDLFPEDYHRIHFVPDTIWHRLLFLPEPYLPKKLFEISFGVVMKLLTELHQRPVIRQLVKRQQIDVIHQPIYVSPKMPSLIFGLGAPVVIGPLNGGMAYPLAFQHFKNRRVMQIVQVGRVLSNFLNRLIPGKRLAATVLVANPRTRKALPAGVKGKIVELVENGVDMALWQPKVQSKAQPKDSLSSNHRSTTRFVFMGRLIDWKAADWLLLAFQQVVQQVPAELEIIGDGPSRESLEQLGAALKLTHSLHSTELGSTTGAKPPVRFSGWLSQADCARHLQQSDVLVLPSLFEAGGAAVLEAMAVGLPVIATNWGGPVDYVDASCGLLITPTSQAGFIQNLADAMITLAQAPDLREQMGRNGRQRVLKYYDWEKKTDAILKIYADTVQRSKLTRSR